MKPDRTLLERLIESVADGRPVDWDTASRAARPEDLRALRDLRLLASLWEVHRSLGGPADSSTAQRRSRRSRARARSRA